HHRLVLGPPVGGELAVRAQRGLRRGAEHALGVVDAAVGEVEGVAAGGGQVGLLDAVVGVLGLAAGRPDGGDGDHALRLGGQGDAGVVDLPLPLGVLRVVGAGVVGDDLAQVGG